MKKIFCLLLVALLSFSLAGGGWAEEDIESLKAQLAERDALIVELQAKIEQLEAENSQPTVETLEKGSKGDAVVKLQKRLKELNYLDGKADGAYGGGTASAVSAFQAAAGLKETGVADEATQAALFAENAPKSKEYVKLDYKANARDPEAYTGNLIKFSGTIIQVMEDDEYVIFRIATKNGYDNVAYATYLKPEEYKRFLEDDEVNVWATSTGVYSYTTIMGGELTIPSCVIERIELK